MVVYVWDNVARESVVAENSGGATPYAIESPADLYLNLSAESGDLVIERSLSWGEAEGRQTVDAIHRVAAVPAAVLETRVFQGAQRLGSDYALFWEGRFMRGEQTLKTVIIALRVDDRNARPLPRSGRLPFDPDDPPFARSLFGGPVLP